MAHRDTNSQSLDELIAEINRSVDVVTAEISARIDTTRDAETLKRTRRFISAKSATLSEAAGVARTAARQLTVARARILQEVARAEEAGLVVQEDFSVSDSVPPNPPNPIGRDHAAAIRAAVTDFSALNTQMSTRLRCAASALKDLREP